MRLPQFILCIQQQADMKGFGPGTQQDPRVCESCWFVPHMKELSIVLYIYHGPICGQIENDDYFSNPTLHVVSRVSQKM